MNTGTSPDSSRSKSGDPEPAQPDSGWIKSLKYTATLLAGLTMPALTGYGEEPSQPERPSATRSIDGPQHAPSGEHLYVRVPGTELSRDFIKQSGFILDHLDDPRGEYVFGYIRRDAFEKLSDGLKGQIRVLDEEAWRHNHVDRKTLQIIPEKRPRAVPGTYEDYHNYADLQAELKKLAADHPDVAVLKSAGKSVEGRELYYMVISDNPDKEENEPNLLYIANMHGDEVVGREMMLYLIRHLVQEYKNDPQIKKLVDNSRIFIMPSMNPDGFERHSRFNANHVDLNRDFPDFTSDPNDTQDGRAPETKAIMDLHKQHNFHIALNFHGGAVCFNIPWDTCPNEDPEKLFPENTLMSRLAREYADASPDMRRVHHGSFDHGVTYGYEWYEVDGGMQDWANFYRKSIHGTVELSDIKWPDGSTLKGFWEENRAPLLKFLQRGAEGLHIEVVDEQNRPIKDVIVGVDSSKRELGFSSNKIHRLTTPGEHELVIKAPGYETQTLRMESEPFNGEFRRIVLRRKDN